MFGNFINTVKRMFKRDVPKRDVKINVVNEPTFHVPATAPASVPNFVYKLKPSKKRIAKKRVRRAMAKRSRKINSMLRRGKVCRTV